MVQKTFHVDEYISSTDFLRVAKRYDISITNLDMVRLKVSLNHPRTFRPRFMLPNIRGRLSKLDQNIHECGILHSCKLHLAGNTRIDSSRYYKEQQSLKKIKSIIEEMVNDNREDRKHIPLPSRLYNHPS